MYEKIIEVNKFLGSNSFDGMAVFFKEKRIKEKIIKEEFFVRQTQNFLNQFNESIGRQQTKNYLRLT